VQEPRNHSQQLGLAFFHKQRGHYGNDPIVLEQRMSMPRRARWTLPLSAAAISRSMVASTWPPRAFIEPDTSSSTTSAADHVCTAKRTEGPE
jgi:hypothetical protein